MRSKSECGYPEFAKGMRSLIVAFKIFKYLIQECVDLARELFLPENEGGEKGRKRQNERDRKPTTLKYS
jgi:hypothetical protein